MKAPKLFFMDTSLAAYLSRWLSAEQLEVGAMSGRYLENYAVSEIAKSHHDTHTRLDCLFYYRDFGQKEFDPLFADGEKLSPLRSETRLIREPLPAIRLRGFPLVRRLASSFAPATTSSSPPVADGRSCRSPFCESAFSLWEQRIRCRIAPQGECHKRGFPTGSLLVCRWSDPCPRK